MSEGQNAIAPGVNQRTIRYMGVRLHLIQANHREQSVSRRVSRIRVCFQKMKTQSWKFPWWDRPAFKTIYYPVNWCYVGTRLADPTHGSRTCASPRNSSYASLHPRQPARRFWSMLASIWWKSKLENCVLEALLLHTVNISLSWQRN